MNVGIITINANSVRNKKANIMLLVDKLKYTYHATILMLTDTRLHGEIDFFLPGFSLTQSNKHTDDSSPGGTAIAVPNTWDVEIVPSITESIQGFESVGILATPPGSHTLKLLSVYNHPQNHVPNHILTNFIDVKSNNKNVDGFIGGDFNCPHEAFHSRFSNIYGTGLLNQVTNSNLMVIENTEPTIYHHGEPNILDLFICEPRSYHMVEECYVEEPIGSDHLPLIAHIVIPTNRNGFSQKTKTFFDANAFKEELSVELTQFDATCNSKSEVDQKLKQLTDMIQAQKAKHTQVKPWRHKRSYLPKEILSWIKTRKDLLKEMKKAQSPDVRRAFSRLYNRANNIVKDLLNEHDNSERERTILEMQYEKDSSKMWKKYNRLKEELQPSNATKRPLINENGEKISAPEDKAEIFAKRLENVHQTPRHPLFDHQFEEHINTFVQQNENLFNEQEYPTNQEDDGHHMLQPITTSDFKEKLGMAKSSSAPGDDQVTYALLKQSPDILFTKLIMILNFCLQIGYFPKQWKAAKVVMVQKPGKDHTNPKSYRPISLLPAISKVFERILCERLVNFLEENDLLNKYQAGYRKGRSTQEHIFRLAQQVYNGFKNRECTYATFLDCEAAFDAVWTKGLLYKMHQLNLPKNFLRILSSFLKDRTLKVHVDGSVSREVQLQAGTPQGSCLSPILFCIHVNDLPFHEMISCNPSQFADDIGLFATGRKIQDAASSMQEALKKVENWCKKWRVKLAPSKTNVVVFTKCHKAHSDRPSLFLFNEELSYTEEATFLGVKFNSSLTWEPQIRALIAKAQPRLNLIKALSTSHGSNNIEMLLKLYKAIVWPIFEYSSIAHVNAAQCHQIKLQRIQNAAIRSILKLPAYIHTDILHDASGLPHLHQHIIQFGKKRLQTMLRQSPILQEVVDQFNQVSEVTTWRSPLEYLL